MKWWKKIPKKIRKVTMLALVFTIGILLAGTTLNQQSKRICRSVNVSIDYSTGNFFVDQQDIKNMILVEMEESLIGQKTEDIPVRKIEEFISENEYIENAEVFLDVKGNLFVKIVQKEPVVRVINRNHVSYYIDKKGNKLPVNPNFTSRVAVSNGFIQDNGRTNGAIESAVLQDVFEIAQFIYQDPFWKAQVTQIYINEDQEIELVPRLGNHTILLGNTDKLDKKLANLIHFYKEGLRNEGWYNYKTINLKYNNQIVAEKY